MDNLIDRKELLNNRPEYLNPQMEDKIASARHQGWNDCNGYYYDLIIKQPTVDTERHAHWEQPSCYDEENGVFQCSNCKEEFVLICGSPKENEYEYCPHCGCKMDEDWNESRNT
jgi:hypothetical protein